jgi:lysine 6-dehydrogenase
MSGGRSFVVLGSGAQGRAVAYDLLGQPATAGIILADREPAALAAAATWLARVAPERAAGGRLTTAVVDASDPHAVATLATGADVLVSCVPYFLNLPLARMAVEVGTSFVDLGGNTEIVRQELALDAAARARGVAVVPDCGLGPGLINTLAVAAMEGMEQVDEVRIYDGGLPQHPEPPLGYMLLFSVEGLLNEYLADATALVAGRRVAVPGLSEIETLDLPAPLGRCEAAHAAGGLSTMAWTFEGRVGLMYNKLIRYPGHIALIHALRDLGFLGSGPVAVDGTSVRPRALAARLLERHLDRPGAPDLVFIRVVVRGRRDGRVIERRCELLDLLDPATGLTAMMRTTGFSAAIVAELIANGTVRPGAWPVENGVPTAPFLAAAEARGFRFEWTTT